MLVPSNRSSASPRIGPRIFSPGATRSGLLRPSPVGPRLDREIADAIGVWLHPMGGAHGDDLLRVAGIGNGAEHKASEAEFLLIPAAVSRSSDNDHAGRAKAVASEANRRRAATIIANLVRYREADIDAVDDRSVVAGFEVKVLHTFDCCEQCELCSLWAAAGDHAQIVQVDPLNGLGLSFLGAWSAYFRRNHKTFDLLSDPILYLLVVAGRGEGPPCIVPLLQSCGRCHC